MFSKFEVDLKEKEELFFGRSTKRFRSMKSSEEVRLHHKQHKWDFISGPFNLFESCLCSPCSQSTCQIWTVSNHSDEVKSKVKTSTRRWNTDIFSEMQTKVMTSSLIGLTCRKPVYVLYIKLWCKGNDTDRSDSNWCLFAVHVQLVSSDPSAFFLVSVWRLAHTELTMNI